MKNLSLLPEDVQDVVLKRKWKCGCGQSGLRYSVTKKGAIQARCFICAKTIYWNDVFMFLDDPFDYASEQPVTKRTKNGKITDWYEISRVRVFREPIE